MTKALKIAILTCTIGALATGFLLLSGCAKRDTSVNFEQRSSDRGVSVLVLKADGSTLRTDADLAADADIGLSEAVKAAKGLLSSGASSAVNTIEEAIGKVEVID